MVHSPLRKECAYIGFLDFVGGALAVVSPSPLSMASSSNIPLVLVPPFPGYSPLDLLLVFPLKTERERQTRPPPTAAAMLSVLYAFAGCVVPQLFHPIWQCRHGAALGALSILRAWNARRRRGELVPYKDR